MRKFARLAIFPNFFRSAQETSHNPDVKSILFAFLIILSQLFFSGMSRPVERSYFHKFIKSKLRATVGSVESMLIGLIGLLAMPLAGLSVDYFGARYTILLSALLMIPSVIIFFKIKDGK